MALLPACANFNELTGPTLVPGVVASVEVPTPEAPLTVGATVALQARVRDASGSTVVDRSVLWTTSDSTIARISAAGVVTGVSVGTVRIAASAQGRSGTANIVIISRPVASILVNPPTPNVLVGGQLQLTSVTLGERGDILSGRSVFWQSSNPIVASIDNTGLLTGLSAGTTTISATSENRSASVGVSVLPVPVATVQITPATDTVVVGQTTQLTAVPRDSIGTPLTDRPVVWGSSNSAIATVSASGLVVGAQAGTVTISASSESQSGASRIVVLARPVGSVIVSPSQIVLTEGASIKLTVLLTDDDGTLLTGRPVTYQSGNTSIARVAADGTVTGIGEGTTNIVVSSGGRTAKADVVVAASPVAAVRISSPASVMAIGATQRLTVTLLDAAGGVLPSRPVVWTSGAPSVASVAEDGTVRALSAGTVVMFAAVEGKLASFTLNVQAITVTSVVVAPASANMSVGEALDLGAQPRDVSGAVIVGRSAVWSTSDERVAVVSSTGRVLALGAGQALITATIDGLTASSAITVTIEAVVSITVAPPSLSLLPGTSGTLVATARGRNGGVLTGRAITFSSADASIATVSSVGVVTAIKTGTTIITVSSEGRQVVVTVTVSPAPVATVAVTLANAARLVGQTTQAVADIRDAGGAALTGRPVVWSSSKQGVATVSSTGVVTAVSAGTTVITATSEGKTGSATLTVSVVPIANITVSLAAPTRVVGETTRATAVVTDSVGGVLTGRSITWSSSDVKVATVDASGLVTAVAPGSADILASSGNTSGRATVTVLRVPVAKVIITLGAAARFVAERTTATVTTLDANNNVLTGRVVVLSSSNATVASVTPNGAVIALAPGTADIIATSEGITGAATLTVTLAPVAAVSVTVPTPARYVGQTTQATVVLRDALGNLLTGRVVTWTAADTSIATVSNTGLVTALAPGGPVNVIATSEGVSGSASVTVSLVPVATVTLTVPQSALQPGQTTQAVAVTRDSVGASLTGRRVTYTSSNPGVATVSASGLIAATTPGTTTITATSEGKVGTISITVTLVSVAAVSVSLNPAQIFVNYTAQATSITRDASGNLLGGRLTTWQTSDPTVATVNVAGVVTALAPGVVTITGTSERISGTAQLRVTIAPVAFVTLAVDNTLLLVGETVQATASTSDINRRPLNGRVVDYSSSDISIATVTQAGVVTAIKEGAVNIVATSEGKSGFVTVHVVAVPVGSVAVLLPGNRSVINVGDTARATADVRDANGMVLTGRTITWTSSDATVATVNSAGVVTGTGVGTVTITAQTGGKSGTASLSVVLAPIATIKVTLASPALQVSQSTQTTVVLLDVNNNVLTGRTFTYSSSNPLVAFVSEAGVVTGLASGTANITVSASGLGGLITGSATVTVSVVPVASVVVTLASSTLQAGAATRASADPRDANGNSLVGRAVTWSSTNAAVATVDANGLVRAVAAGTAGITAASGGKSGSTTLTVTTPPPARVATVSVTLGKDTLAVGQTTSATAVTRDSAGGLLTGRVITYNSSNAGVATISASGVITAVTSGSSIITATSEGKAGTISIIVTAVPVAALSVSIAPAQLFVTYTAQASSITRDAAGNVLVGRLTTWTTSDRNIATVTAGGVVTALAPGVVTITGTSEGISGTAQLGITVAPVAFVTITVPNASLVVGQQTQAIVNTADANERPLNGRVVLYSSSDTSVATVTQGGVVVGRGVGSAKIVATSEGKSGFVTVNVSSVPVGSVAVRLSGNRSVINVGDTARATADVRDANGMVLTGRTITWTSSDVTVATVNSAGVVTGRGVGTVIITAQTGGKSGTASISVVLAPIATIQVTLASPSLQVLQSTQATVVLLDANNNVLTGRSITYASSNPLVAFVTQSGAVTGLFPGTATITVSAEGVGGVVTGTVDVAVSLVPVRSVVVTLGKSRLASGATTQANADPRDANGNSLSGRTITWSSTDVTVATVDTNGVVTALAPGTADIVAATGGRSGLATLTVTAPPPAPVATVSVTLAEDSVVAGQTVQASAVTRDAASGVLTGRVITWATSDANIATVNANGLVTTISDGTVTVTAKSEGKTGSATLTVSLVPVATVQISLASTIPRKESRQASVVLRDAKRNVLTGRLVVWSTSNKRVLTVDQTGVVKAVARGTASIIATSEGQSDSIDVKVP